MFLNSSKSSKQESITAAHNVCKAAKALLDFSPAWTQIIKNVHLHRRGSLDWETRLPAGTHSRLGHINVQLLTNNPVNAVTDRSSLCRKQNSIKLEIAALEAGRVEVSMNISTSAASLGSILQTLTRSPSNNPFVQLFWAQRRAFI